MTRHYRFLSIVSLVLSLSILSASTPADALSCAPTEESYFMTCEKGACLPAFRAKQIRIGDACRRRLVIEPVPPWALEAVATLLRTTAGLETSGVYQILLLHNRWEEAFGKATDLEWFLNNEAKTTHVDRLTTDRSAISDLRAQWQSRADLERFWEVVGNAVDFGILAVLLWVLYRSASRFVYCLRAFFLNTHPVRKLWKPLLIQVGLFLIGTSVYSFRTAGIRFFIGYLAPAVFLVWLLEAGMYVYLWSRRFMRLRGTI